MLKNFNIALIPLTKEEEAIKLAQKLLTISDQYQLGKNSLPHITLCQFQAKEKEVDEIWKRVCEAVPEHSIELELKDFSCITFNNIVFWVSLLPNQRPALNKVHQIVANSVKVPVNNLYDPHMTLISTKNKEYKEKVDILAKSYVAISDTFVLSIGECDLVGQFTTLEVKVYI